MKPGSLSEEAIKSLQAPDKGNSITYFAGAIVQGARLRVASGFGSRLPVIAPSSSTIACADVNTASQLAHGRIGLRSRLFEKLATYASALTGAKTR